MGNAANNAARHARVLAMDNNGAHSNIDCGGCGGCQSDAPQSSAGWHYDWQSTSDRLCCLQPTPCPSNPSCSTSRQLTSGARRGLPAGCEGVGHAGGAQRSGSSCNGTAPSAARPSWPPQAPQPTDALLRQRGSPSSPPCPRQHGCRWRFSPCLGRGWRPGVAGLLRLLVVLLAACGDPHATAAAQESGAGSAPAEGTASCEPPSPMSAMTMTALGCERFHMMCIDQQQFITYDPKFNPRLTTAKVPKFDVSDMVYNWPNPWGNGDKFETGRDLRVPRVLIRVNTSEESCADLQSPVFSSCTTPLVLWQRWMFNVGEVYETSYVRMYDEYAQRMFDPRLSLVVATPHGLRMPRFMPVFFQSMFQRQLATLADFSDRRPGEANPSNSTAEGLHIRCFETLYMCKIKNRKESGLCAAGAHLLQHYADRLPPVGELFDPEADKDALKVVFASRPNATGRAILNEAELLVACNALDPTAELGSGRAFDGRIRRVKCVSHVFGRDLMYDMSLSKTMDVLVATHGAAGYHSFYMSRGASLVEVIPFRFASAWVNVYYAKMLEYEKKVFYWAIWISSADNSHPSAFQDNPVFRKEYVYREYHMTLHWEPLKQHLLSIMRVGGKATSYKSAYTAGKHSIGDDMLLVEARPDIGRDGWKYYTSRGE